MVPGNAYVLVPLIGTLNHSVEEFVLGKQDREFIILRPNSWIGNRFPLIKNLDRELPIESGNWQIVLFHQECSQSQLILDRILNDTQIRTLLLELPSDASSVKEDANNLFWATLKSDSKWFVSTPVFITLEDGIVTGCANDKNLFGQQSYSRSQDEAQ